MSDCRVNIKEEKLEQKMVEKSRGEVKSNRSEDPAVVVQLDVSLDSYLPPGPRQPDTLVMASRRSAHYSRDILYKCVLPCTQGVKVRNSSLDLQL